MINQINPLDGYESPITVIIQKVSEEINNERMDRVMYHIEEKIGVKIDKDALMDALNKSKQSYEKGYNAGYARAKKDMMYFLAKQRPSERIE